MDRENLSSVLEDLYVSCNSSTFRDAVETLLKIHRNILQNKNVPKYRQLKLQNQTFANKIWGFEQARSFMIKCGWILVEDVIEFHGNEKLLTIIDVLLEYRLLSPKESEWKEETKVENLHVSEEKEKELREKAALERKKELKEFYEEQMQRQKLGEKIRKQIADDKEHRKFYSCSRKKN